MGRPLIGVTAGSDEGSSAPRRVLRDEYVRAVEGGGGIPVLLTPGKASDAATLLSRIDGLVLSGGGDLDPALFGQARGAELREPDRERDDFELALTREALARDVPLLGICRGVQVLNVAVGGTLHQDLASSVIGGERHDRNDRDDESEGRTELAHDVDVVPGTLLERTLRMSGLAVNSLHHQAVDRIGDGLAVAAVCPVDGMIEAIEAPRSSFALGVQWHPESFWNDAGSPSLRLFRALASAARERSHTAHQERMRA